MRWGRSPCSDRATTHSDGRRPTQLSYANLPRVSTTILRREGLTGAAGAPHARFSLHDATLILAFRIRTASADEPRRGRSVQRTAHNKLRLRAPIERIESR